ncbi:Tn3 family transposase, partial [Escherichia coli]
VRDSTYVLDGLLYHESDLRIEEHYTDTAGFTDHVFALMHLLGVLGIFRPKTTKCSGGPAVCGLQRGITFFEIPIWALFE